MKKNLSIALVIMIMCLFIGYLLKENYRLKVTQKIKIGVCLSDFNDKFWTYTLNEMKRYSKSLNDVEIIYADAKQDSNTQLSQVEDLISQGVDAIVINPVDLDVTKLLTDKAKEAKVPIISFNEPFANENDSTCYVGSDAKQQGILQMEYIAKKMNYKGNVAIIIGKLGETQNSRTSAYHQVIAKYPNMNIVAEQAADWNRARAMALTQTWLESDKKIDAIVCNSDEMAIGALKAVEASGKLGNIIVGGIDGTPDALAYLKSGKLAVTVFQDGVGISRGSIDTAIKLAKGENVEKNITFVSELVTPEDAEKYMAKWEDN